MQIVTGIFTNQKQIPLTIKASSAIYNNFNYNTNFSDNVIIKYKDNTIRSENLNLDFEKNIITIYNNVVYEGVNGLIKTDNIKINLLTKDVDIFMNNPDNNINIKNPNELMSNIKKFRIKSFKDKKSILQLDKISLKYGRKTILDNLSLGLNNGQILGLLGPNGVGKTTLFNIITGLILPDFGSVIINSEKVNKYPIYERTLKYKLGFVPQHGGFFHDLTVYENLQAIAEITISDMSFRNEKNELTNIKI